MTFETRENSQTRCPSCEHGMGHLTGIRVDGASRVFSYTCATCDYRWQASERWLDEWWPGKSTEPQMIKDEAGASKKRDS